VSDRLRDPSGSYDVLSLVLDYAAAEFGRVAIFMIREDLAVGMARRGFDPVGAPGVAGLEEVELFTSELPEPFVPERRPIGDTAALEVVLHEAGLALDRSALERALTAAERG
jgi:hypothetical protein